jgi:hypothetical protein
MLADGLTKHQTSVAKNPKPSPQHEAAEKRRIGGLVCPMDHELPSLLSVFKRVGVGDCVGGHRHTVSAARCKRADAKAIDKVRDQIVSSDKVPTR